MYLIRLVTIGMDFVNEIMKIILKRGKNIGTTKE